MRVLKGTCLLSPSVYHVLGERFGNDYCQVLPTSERDPTRWAFVPMYSSSFSRDGVLYSCRAFLLRGGNNFLTAIML